MSPVPVSSPNYESVTDGYEQLAIDWIEPALDGPGRLHGTVVETGRRAYVQAIDEAHMERMSKLLSEFGVVHAWYPPEAITHEEDN